MYSAFGNKTLKEIYPTSEEFCKEFQEIDTATATAIYQGFYWRTVCDDQMFAPYLHSMWNRIGQQYNDLLRVQLTRFDPVVTRYLERQIKRGGTDKTETSGTTEYNSTVTDTAGKSVTLEHGEKITAGGRDNTYSERHQAEKTHVSQVTAERQTETGGTAVGVGASDSRSLNASLPRVDTYSANGINSPVDIPANVDGTSNSSGIVKGGFDWRNADGQAETVGATSSNSKTTGTSSAKVLAPDTSDTEVSYEGQPDQNYTDYGRTDTHSGQDITTHSGEDTSAHTGYDSTSGGSTVTHDTEDRERYTGHDGPIADLLKKAADYIQATGAFSWLSRWIDHCFIDVYDF